MEKDKPKSRCTFTFPNTGHVDRCSGERTRITRCRPLPYESCLGPFQSTEINCQVTKSSILRPSTMCVRNVHGHIHHVHDQEIQGL